MMLKIRQKDTPSQFNIPDRKLKNMICMHCRQTFFIRDPNHIRGSRVPVLRYCGHTMCEECSKDDTKLNCSRCENDSSASTFRNPAINFYAVGLMFAQSSRPAGIAKTKDDEFNFQKSTSSLNRQTIQCCNECKDAAACRCMGCSQFYCDGCFGKIHAFQSLKSHTKVSLKHKENAPPQLAIVCEDHTPNIMKHWCTECKVKCCTDCIVYEHRTHSTIEIQKMNELCQQEFAEVYEAVANVMGQVRNARMEVTAALKLPDEEENNARVESEINQHFLHLHGILQNLESQMIDILHAQSNGRLRNLIEIQEELQCLETQVEHGILLAGLAKQKSESVNHMDIIKKLKDLTNVRCYLLKREGNNKNEESITFHADESIFAAIEDHCNLETKPLSKLFSLVAADELPENYMIQAVARESLSVPLIFAPTPSSTLATSKDPIVENRATSDSSNVSIPTESQSRKGYEVHVTFISHPYRFYVREKSDDHLYEKIERELEKYSTRDESIPETVVPGKIYVVQGNRHKWYRGRVRSIITTDTQYPSGLYEMCAIDHGFIHKVDKSRLRTLSPKLCDIPPLAKHHKLFDIFPINGKSWSLESIEEMRKIVNIAADKLPRLYKVDNDGQVGSDLLIPTSIHNDALSVRDTLLFLGHGKFESTEKLLKLNPSASNIYHHDPVELGKYYDVICLHVESPTCFYVRKADYNEGYFEKMITEMTADYKSTKRMKSLIYNPVIGLNCAAPYNGSWHRGVISNIPEIKKIEVFFVDLGLKSSMEYDKIRRLDPCYTRANTRAIKLSLDGIEIPNDGMLPNIKNMMIEFMDPSAKMIASAKTDDNGYSAFLRDRANLSLRYFLNANHHGDDQVASSLENKSGNSPKTSGSKLKSKRKNDSRNFPDLYEFINTNQNTPQKKPVAKPQPKPDLYLCPVNVQHVVSPDEIYLTTTNRTETFDEIHDKMQKFYTKLKSKGSPDIFKGAMCAVRLPRNSAYYRAKIVTINDDNMKVFCIDEGKHEIVPKQCIQSLAPELHEIPAYLFKVRLGGIHPTCGKSTWTSLSCEKLIEIIGCNETKNFFIAKVGEPVNDAMTVDLYVEQATIIDAIAPPIVEKNIINRMLVEAGLALPIRHYNENKLKVLAEDVKKEMKFHDKSVVKPMPEDFSNTDASQDSEDFIKDPAQDMSKHFPRDIPTWLPAEYISKNSFRARTTYIDWDGFIYLHSIEQIAPLKTIEDTLLNHYKLKEVCGTDQWSPGDMCMVKYHGSDKWGRGVVHEIRGKYISVEFIDYGNLEWQEHQSLCKDLMLKEIPRIATKCQIYGLISNSPNGKWNAKELYYMHPIVVDKECTVTILRRMKGYNIIKVNCIDGLNRDLIAHLVHDRQINICLEDINLHFKSDVDSDCSADIYTESDRNVDYQDDDSADVVIEGTIEDYTDENAEDNIKSNEFTKNSTDEMGTPKSTDESIQNYDIVRTTVNTTVKRVGESEKLKRLLIDNSDRSDEKSYISEIDCDKEEDDDYSGDIEEDYFESDERICQALLPHEYRSILDDFQLPNNDGKYRQLILPETITEFRGAIGEVDAHESNIVWLHPSETESCSVLNYYRAAYTRLQIAMDLEADQQPLIENIDSGTPCCALYNGFWHRGSIVSPVILSGMIEVLYVDWGNIGLVEVNQIYTIKKEWFDLPTLAIKCRLWGTRIADNAKAKTWFQFKRDNSKDLYRIEIVGRELDRAVVKIFDEDNDERLMYQDLIDQKIFLNNLKDHYAGIV